MLVVTYSEARENFAAILDRAKSDGGVIVTRKDGSRFKITEDTSLNSPFDNFKPVVTLKPGSALEALADVRKAQEEKLH